MNRTLSVTVSVLLAASVAAAGDYTEIFDQTYEVAHGAAVGLDNINGDVTITVWDRPEVRVQAVKSASSPERLEGLKIEVDARQRGVFIDTRYPDSRRLHPVDRHGHSEVEYTLTVPRSVVIDGVDLVNGDLVIDGVEGEIDADTVNGSVVVRGGMGEIELETVNGRIEVDLAPAAAGDVSLESVNGTVEVFVAEAAEIRAETVNGSIRNDFGIEIRKGRYVGSSMAGAVGAGGPTIEIETVNGGIRVSSS